MLPKISGLIVLTKNDVIKMVRMSSQAFPANMLIRMVEVLSFVRRVIFFSFAFMQCLCFLIIISRYFIV